MLAPGTQIGGYLLNGVLGQGGMGVVYEAYQPSLKRKVALKLLAQELARDQGFKERFRREGVQQATVDHPHIVPVYEAGESDEGLFLVMRLIRGSNLKRLISERGLHPDVTLRLLAPVAAALDAAHARGLIHRDVKPHNILIEGEHPFLTDFGLTKTSEDLTLTQTGQFVGTPAYVAPEQIHGTATCLSDIYSLGVVLFECITGNVPFPRQLEVAVMYAHLHDPPPRISDRRTDLPKDLDKVIDRALAKDPGDRPQTATQLIEEVRRAVTSVPSQMKSSHVSDADDKTFEPLLRVGDTTRLAAPVSPSHSESSRWVPQPFAGGRRRRFLQLTVLASILGLTGLALVVTSQDQPFASAGEMVPLFAGLTGAAALVAVLLYHQWLRSPLATKPASGQAPADPERKLRGRLLNLVSQSYATYLDQSLAYTVRVQPRLERVPNETFRVADALLPVHRRRERLADGTSLLQVFETAGGLSGPGFLVLGDPGAGKTTLLAELGLQLTERAGEDLNHPLAVYLPLSTWGVDRPDFEAWVVDQLQELYQVPSSLAYEWLDQDSAGLVLLLDGLDEIVGTEARVACIDEINRFGRDCRVPVVVASRRAEYDTLGIRLQLETAVALQPLDPAKVLAHLRERGSETSGVLALMERNPELIDLLKSPLLLSMLTLAYAGQDDDVLLEGGEVVHLEQLIADYFNRRIELERLAQGPDPSERNAYAPERTRRWLAALARGLTRHQQTIFLLERIRPDLLPSRRARRFVVMAPKLVFGLGAGIIAFAVDGEVSRRLRFDDEPIFHLFSWTLLGLVAGLVGHLRVRHRLAVWGGVGLAAGLSFAVVIRALGPLDILVQGLYFVCVFGVVGELMVRLVPDELEPAERLSWSWVLARPYVVRGLVVGILTGPAFGLLFGLSLEHQGGPATGRWFWLFGFGPSIGFLWGLSRGVGRGLSPALRPARAVPNEGIRRSVRHGALVGVATLGIVEAIALAGYLGSLLLALDIEFFNDLIVVLLLGAALGAGCGLLLGIASGLGAAIQHFTIRLFLWRYGLAPLRYVAWLSYAVRLRMLYWGVGGGHIFIHGVVQEYFAGLIDSGKHQRLVASSPRGS